METTAEGRMRVPETNEPDQVLHHGFLQGLFDLPWRVEMPVDVAPDPRFCQQLHVIVAGEQADVIHLGNPRQKELDRTSEQIAEVIATHRIVKGAVDLVQIQIRGGCTRCETTLSAAVQVDLLDELLEL